MFILFLISLFILNLPPFQLYILNVQNIFAGINILIFLHIFLISRNRRILINKIKKNKTESYILTCLFVVISISVFQALDAALFLNKYASILLSLLVYINITFFEIKVNKYIYTIFFAWIIANLINELFLFLNPNLYLSTMPNFLVNKELIMVKDEISRNRLTISTYIEIFLPILYWLYFKVKKNRFVLLIQIILINILAFYSGWRIRGIICITSLLQIVRIYWLSIKKLGFYLKLSFLIIPFVVFILLNTSFITNNPTLNRLLYEDQNTIGSDETRTHILGQSLDIFKANPLFGVGLNNNYIYRQNSQFSPDKSQNSSKLVREAGSHNLYIDLLLDIGIFGFIVFFTLLTFWLYEDRENIKNKDIFPFILAYYLILLYAFFHSIGGYRFFSILFLLRSIIKNNRKVPYIYQ